MNDFLVMLENRMAPKGPRKQSLREPQVATATDVSFVYYFTAERRGESVVHVAS